MHVTVHPTIAASEADVDQLKRALSDPIVFKENEHEVSVYTAKRSVWERIRAGNAWHMGFEEPDSDGYRKYVYTRLNVAQVVEHLVDPTRHQGGDT